MAGADKRLYKQISHEGPTSELEVLAPAEFPNFEVPLFLKLMHLFYD